MSSRWDDIYVYDPTSPSGLRWACDVYTGMYYTVLNKRNGDVAGTFDPKQNRWCVRHKGKGTYVHRVIWEIHNGPIPSGLVIDHIDGNSSNNVVTNLRVVTQRVNQENRRISSRSKTNVCGVLYLDRTRPNGKYVEWYRAVWKKRNLKSGGKDFNIGLLGRDEAFRLACEYRKRMLEEQKALGAQYTERHGELWHTS